MFSYFLKGSVCNFREILVSGTGGRQVNCNVAAVREKKSGKKNSHRQPRMSVFKLQSCFFSDLYLICIDRTDSLKFEELRWTFFTTF